MSVTPPANSGPQVEFWFDAVCPWCWMTSRWLQEVAIERGFSIVWHPVSLEILNEHRDTGDHAPNFRIGLHLGRVIEAARRAHGDQVVGGLYAGFGKRFHPEASRDEAAIIAETLAEVGLPATLAAAAADASLDATLRANTDHALEIAGPDVGVPVISVDGTAFFGPVVTPSPTGEAALQLWDGIFAAANVPGFYELKRGRTAGPQF
ncbi:DsbA family protein [Leucobacter luti]|uniref:2-hydroxychromene-2-carboxylate isomerase n=1 Tax=Leucobacter luti TaxID=340320 RepID=A0A4Q7TXV9_9MICO|nr:DsbA family protein [Leucobacter luti]MBL3698199.1 disulfide bond formation protein DsbA [Leucobacter luti]RZT64718.1 2-hydroxychromene-2-carboxylate isomerase [Leucobacter luti]